MGLGLGMLRRPPRYSVGSVGAARRPESRGCTLRCGMVGPSTLKSAPLQKSMSVYD